MRALSVLILMASLTVSANACPWVRRDCQPCPPVHVRPYYASQCSPVRVIRIIQVPIPPPQVVAAPNEEVAPEGWCHIKGRIVFDGNPPKQAEIPNAKGAYTEDWVVDPGNRGVKNVIVWLAPEPSPDEWERLKSKRLREYPSFHTSSIFPNLRKDQDQEVLILEAPIAFIPHVVAVRAGSDVVFKNISTRAENVKWVSRNNGEANRVMPPGGQEVRIGRTKTERIPFAVESSIHPWMKAYVRVFDHPYFAVTSPDGTFEIKFAPKGKLRLFVWQETAGYRNGAEGRFGEAIEVPSGRLDLGELKIKAAP